MTDTSSPDSAASEPSTPANAGTSAAPANAGTSAIPAEPAAPAAPAPAATAAAPPTAESPGIPAAPATPAASATPDAAATSATPAIATTPGAEAYSVARPARRRVSPLVLLAIGLGVAALIAAIAIPASIAARQSAEANDRYDSALAQRTDAADELTTALGDVDSMMPIANDYLAIADDTVAAAVDGYVGAEQLAVLSSARDALTAAIDAATGIDARVSAVAERPTGTSELDAATAELTAEVPQLTSALTELMPLSTDLAERTLATSDAGDALIATVAVTADALLTANYSAENLVHIQFTSVLDSLSTDLFWGDDLAPQLADYVSAAQQLQASNASEEAQKGGPLYPQRVAIEAFARSIAGGVLLDFDWAPVVNGYGNGYGYGGTSTWNTAAPGYSTITLSNSVAELWGVNSAVSSLVAHEVGHSITSKCYDLFSTSFDSQDEVWATAWAIGLGYAEDGSGESIYGRPSDAQIALTTQCR